MGKNGTKRCCYLCWVITFFCFLFILKAEVAYADTPPTSKLTMVNIQVDLEKEGDQFSVYNILSEIESRGWNVTVYVTGEFATHHPGVVKDIHDRGHQIAVHGWQSGEDLTLLTYEQQLDLLTQAFTAVRSAVGRMNPEYISDFRPQEFKQDDNTFRVLQTLGVRSNSGFISGQGVSRPSHTRYGFVAIPIANLYGCGCPGGEDKGICLCDHYIFDVLGASPNEYLKYLKAKYDQNNVSKAPMSIIVHSYIMMADANRLQALSKFLDHIRDHGGQVVLTDLITSIANRYITGLLVEGPSSAKPGQAITLTIKYVPTCYCPTYYFKIYGQYKLLGMIVNPAGWIQLDAWSHFHEANDVGVVKTWHRDITIPEIPNGEKGTYLVRVVGWACHSDYNCWPSPYSYEAIRQISINVKPDSVEVKNGLEFYKPDRIGLFGREEEIPGPVFARGGDHPEFLAEVCKADSVKVEIFGTSNQIVKTLDLQETSENKWEGEWDWTSNNWGNIPYNIPVGEYMARFKVLKEGFETTEDKIFYVIFNKSEVIASDRFIYDETCVWFAPGEWSSGGWYWGGDTAFTYELHQDDNRVFSKAIASVKGKTSAYEAAAVLRAWEHGYITHDPSHDPGQNHYNVLDLLDSKRGECCEDASLLTAVLRSVGIPAHPVAIDANELRTWNFHTWTEALVDGPDGEEWYSLDGFTGLGPYTRQRMGTRLHQGNEYERRSSRDYAKKDKWEDSPTYNLDVNDLIIMAAPNWTSSEVGDPVKDVTFKFFTRDNNENIIPARRPNGRPVATQHPDYFQRGWIRNLSYEYWGVTHDDPPEPPEDQLITVSLDKEQYNTGDIISINVDIQNDTEAPIISTAVIAINLNKSEVKGSPFQTLQSYQENLTVLPGTSKRLSKLYQLPQNLSSNDMYYVEATFAEKRAFALFQITSLSADLELPDSVAENETFIANLTITNPQPVSINNINAHLTLPSGIDTSESLDKNIPVLGQGASRNLSWNFNAVAPGEIAMLSAVITSDNGGSVTIHAGTVVVDVPPLLDLGISSGDVTVLPESVRESDYILVLATIHNTGEESIDPAKVQFLVDGNVIEEKTMSITANSTEDTSFNWEAQTGTHTLKIKIDPGNQINETNEGNNEYSWQWQMGTGTPDFIVSAIRISPSPIFAGEEAQVVVTINNLADESVERELEIDLFLNNNLAGTQTINLDYGYEAPLFTWTAEFSISAPSAPGTAQIKVIVDPNDAINEINEDNNENEVSVGVQSTSIMAWESNYGTQSALGDEDDSYLQVPIGFNYPFYGVNYTDVYIGTNGFLTFGAGDYTYSHGWYWGNLPRIAPLWTDLSPSIDGDVYYNTLTSPNRFVVTWLNVAHFDQGGRNTFQVVIYESGLIQMGWRNLDFHESNSEALTGVTNGDGNITSLGEGLEFDEGTLDYQNRWFVWDGNSYDMLQSRNGIFLDPGWNLISFSVRKCFYEGNPPADQPACVELVNIRDLGFNSLADWFSSVIMPYGVWRMVIGLNGAMDATLPNVFHTLKYMSPTSGYWVRIDENRGSANLYLEGAPFDPGCRIHLQKDWNLAGYPLTTGYYDTDPPPYVPGVTNWVKVDPPVAEYVFRSIAGKYSMIIGEYGAYDPALPPAFSSLKYVAPGGAYWIKMNTEADLVYSPPGAGILSLAAPARNIAKSSPVPARTFMLIYGNISCNGKEAMVGNQVRFFTQSGILCGQASVTNEGYYGMIMVYGDDPDTPQIEGARPGEKLTLHASDPALPKLGVMDLEFCDSNSESDISWLGDKAIQRVDLAFQSRPRPEATLLWQNYPNPFNPDTWIPYQLKEDARVEIEIYAATGQLVRILNLGYRPVGFYTDREKAAYWDGKNEAGEPVASGIYFYSIKAGNFSATRKMVIVR